jgi:predicted Zn-dependent protease
MTTEELLEQATERHRKGELGEARSLYQQLLSTSPDHPVTLFRMGLLELHDKHPQEAVKLIGRAIAAKPEEAKFHFGLGEVLAAQGQWLDAAAAY